MSTVDGNVHRQFLVGLLGHMKLPFTISFDGNAKYLPELEEKSAASTMHL